MEIIGNFIEEKDLKLVQSYIQTINFHTKDDHVPLHDSLFNNPGTQFDIHTRGEMPDSVLEVFSKYSKGFYDYVTSRNSEEYHPAMFSKHYIARYRPGSQSEPHHSENEKPEGTYGSYIIWQNPKRGGEILFPNRGLRFNPSPGDLIVFEEKEIDSHGIAPIIEGYMFLSEAWMGRKGQLWMQNKTPYNEVPWDDWEIKGFYE